MALFNYVDAPNPNLVCCICRMPFMAPYTTRNCSHTFCRDCILKSLEHSAQCPIDRTSLKAEELNPADPIIRSLVDELSVDCSNRALGCAHICQRQLFAVHLKTCPYGQVPCPDGKCAQFVLRKDIGDHKCTHDMASCDACGNEVNVSDLESHRNECYAKTFECKDCTLELPYSLKPSHSASCPEAAIHCTQDMNGCTWEGRRASLACHLTTCPYEAIKGFFSLHEKRNAALADENMILKQRISSFENGIHDITAELRNIILALGPWYHSQSFNFREVSSQLPPALQPLSASSSELSHPDNLSNPPTHVSASAHALPSSPIDQSHDYFASFFPAEQYSSVSSPSQNSSYRSDMSPRPEIPDTRRMRALSNLSGQGWETFNYMNYPRVAAQNIVAPLNLNTSLEGTLQGLRESVVSLSTSLDSLGRRNDVALTNETLRLNEELMSLRANMQGLRMQVHTIMMDRNAQVTGRGPELLPGDTPWVAAGRLHPPQTQSSMSITKL